MSIIRVENLSKRYRIGLNKKKHSHKNSFVHSIKLPFDYLFDTLRKPSEEEIFWALKDINFEVQQGDVLGVIGKNGAGKSTLLKILSRITEPTSGKATIKGRVGSLLEVGTGFHQDLTGRENIFLSGSLLGMTKIEIQKKFDEIVDFSGIEKFVDTPVKRYSSGMFVRLGFAVAAHLDPEILIIDEVLAVGDSEFQKKCLGKMGDISKQGRTVLFVSHNMTAVQTLCNKTILLGGGTVKDIGNTSDVINNYLENSSIKNNEIFFSSIEEAPGNDFIRVRKTSVLNDNPNRTNSNIYVSSPVKIEIEFWNLKENKVSISMHLNSLKGDCIFNVSTKSEKIEKGIHKAVCYIPENFLNDGKYSISNMFVKDSSSVLFNHEDAVHFEVHEEPREDVAWFGKWAGAVRPTFLKWDYYKISE